GGQHSDDDTAFVRPLTPPEILVVTFTNAATQELRERIRHRLVEAAEVFRKEPGQAKGAGQSEGLLPGMAKVAPREGFTAPSRRP
ncbi:UvrD-helicase domain-containing protein, partial [Proteus terrae]|uniref:UvrD-helicase domain-containing protein n=1 Tax=Proteus terrae TaxID=1574161 RepID=UPI00301D612A